MVYVFKNPGPCNIAKRRNQSGVSQFLQKSQQNTTVRAQLKLPAADQRHLFPPPAEEHQLLTVPPSWSSNPQFPKLPGMLPVSCVPADGLNLCPNIYQTRDLGQSLSFSGLQSAISKIIINMDFPGGPMAKIPCSQCRGLGLIPGQGTRFHMLQVRVCKLQVKIPMCCS